MISMPELIASLTLKRIDETNFITTSIAESRPRIFGGLVISQSIMAVLHCNIEKNIHSLHAHFIAPGDPQHQIIYKVQYLKKGYSFDLMRCDGLQNNRLIYTMTASFHQMQNGFSHSLAMPAITPDDAPMPALAEINPELISNASGYLEGQRPFSLKPMNAHLFSNQKQVSDKGESGGIWFKSHGEIPANPKLHTALLGYISDMSLLNASLTQHGSSIFDPRVQTASLDHSLWFHASADMNNWIYYHQDSAWADHGRGLSRGLLYQHNGLLLASSAQEGLIRFKA
jgi:acyl-CoA thioesterase II